MTTLNFHESVSSFLHEKNPTQFSPEVSDWMGGKIASHFHFEQRRVSSLSLSPVTVHKGAKSAVVVVVVVFFANCSQCDVIDGIRKWNGEWGERERMEGRPLSCYSSYLRFATAATRQPAESSFLPHLPPPFPLRLDSSSNPSEDKSCPKWGKCGTMQLARRNATA